VGHTHHAAIAAFVAVVTGVDHATVVKDEAKTGADGTSLRIDSPKAPAVGLDGATRVTDPSHSAALTARIVGHGCPGEPCRVCALDRLVARSPLTRAQTLNALRDHHRREVAHFWAPRTHNDPERSPSR
jgi:hypothetical protein